VLHVHRYAISLSGLMLRFRPIAHGLPHNDAERFGAEFDRYRGLLTLHDRERG
jgi:hypothetical protein